MIRHTRGAALLLALVVVLLVNALVCVALWAALGGLRTTSGVRLGIEGEIAASSALAVARVQDAAALHALLPGESISLPTAAVGGWVVRLDASRVDSLVFLHARAELRSGADSLLGARSRTLVIAHGASDTLRVLRGRSQF